MVTQEEQIMKDNKNTKSKAPAKKKKVKKNTKYLIIISICAVVLVVAAIPMFFYKIAGKEKKDMVAALQAKREAEGFVVNE